MVDDGDVVEIDYVGRIANSGEIFDLTDEEVAKEEGIDTEGMSLGTIQILVGSHHVIDGLEDALKEMSTGDSTHVELDAKHAFGERERENVKTFSKRDFDEFDVRPQRGMMVEIDGRRGKVISASSGRVRVDFNHPLAGKDVEYDITLHRVLDDAAERVQAILDFHGLEDVEVSVEDGETVIELPDEANRDAIKHHLKEELLQVKGVETVSFGDEGSEDAD